MIEAVTLDLCFYNELQGRFECSFLRSKFGSSSRPEIRSSTIPIFHLLRFRFSSLMMTTSPLAKGVV